MLGWALNLGFAGSGAAVSPPVFTGAIGDQTVQQNAGVFQYVYSSYFTGDVDSYSISPSLESGWSFDTDLAQLTIDTNENGNFGPFTVTATNAGGSDSSNTFSIIVLPSVGGAFFDFEVLRPQRKPRFKGRTEEEKQAAPILEEIAQKAKQSAQVATSKDMELLLRLRLEQEDLAYKALYMTWLRKQAAKKQKEYNKIMRKRRKEEDEIIYLLLN